jgi:hypothetical protein
VHSVGDPANLKLIFSGKILDNDKTIEEAKIKDKVTSAFRSVRAPDLT